MSNCNKLFMQSVSKSDMRCKTCNHVYDENVAICTCKPENRNIVEFKEYLRSAKEKN